MRKAVQQAAGESSSRLPATQFSSKPPYLCVNSISTGATPGNQYNCSTNGGLPLTIRNESTQRLPLVPLERLCSAVSDAAHHGIGPSGLLPASATNSRCQPQCPQQARIPRRRTTTVLTPTICCNCWTPVKLTAPAGSNTVYTNIIQPCCCCLLPQNTSNADARCRSSATLTGAAPTYNLQLLTTMSPALPTGAPLLSSHPPSAASAGLQSS